MYDSENKGMWAKFGDLPIGSSFTSRDIVGNVYLKEAEGICKCTDFNLDDEIVERLHIKCGGIVHNIYALKIEVEDNYDVLLYHRKLK